MQKLLLCKKTKKQILTLAHIVPCSSKSFLPQKASFSHAGTHISLFILQACLLWENQCTHDNRAAVRRGQRSLHITRSEASLCIHTWSRGSWKSIWFVQGCQRRNKWLLLWAIFGKYFTLRILAGRLISEEENERFHLHEFQEVMQYKRSQLTFPWTIQHVGDQVLIGCGCRYISVKLVTRVTLLLYIGYFTVLHALGSDWLLTWSSVAGLTFIDEF